MNLSSKATEAARLVPALALGALVSCEQHYSANPPFTAETFAAVAAPNAVDAGPAAGRDDAGARSYVASHAMTITLCSQSSQPCSGIAEASGNENYRVVFGSGRGSIRSRGQAVADLYDELRSRTTAGDRLDAEVQTPASGRPPAPSGGSSAHEAPKSSDPLANCAMELLNVVDDAGEVTLDVLHGSASEGCMISMGRVAADGGTSQCLVQEPEHPHRPGRQGGLTF